MLLAVVLCSVVCTLLPNLAAADRVHIGYLYKIDGYQHGQRVVYVGQSARSLKARFNGHEWADLLRQKTTKVWYKKVYAELDINASSQKTLRSARLEALNSVEQVELDKARKDLDKANRKRQPRQKRSKVGNKIEAAKDPHSEIWQKRHNVKAASRWTKLRESASPRGSVKLRAAGGLLLLIEAYRLYYDYKVSKFVMAPYLLEDEHGVFTLDYSKNSWLSDTKYFKNYVAGEKQGEKVQVSKSEFEDLAEEAKALWGTIDWKGNFVPGLLLPSLEVIVERA